MAFYTYKSNLDPSDRRTQISLRGGSLLIDIGEYADLTDAEVVDLSRSYKLVSGPRGNAASMPRPVELKAYYGPYQAGFAYPAGAQITYSGSEYLSLKPSTGVVPGSDDATWKTVGGGGGTVLVPKVVSDTYAIQAGDSLILANADVSTGFGITLPDAATWGDHPITIMGIGSLRWWTSVYPAGSDLIQGAPGIPPVSQIVVASPENGGHYASVTLFAHGSMWYVLNAATDNFKDQYATAFLALTLHGSTGSGFVPASPDVVLPICAFADPVGNYGFQGVIDFASPGSHMGPNIFWQDFQDSGELPFDISIDNMAFGVARMDGTAYVSVGQLNLAKSIAKTAQPPSGTYNTAAYLNWASPVTSFGTDLVASASNHWITSTAGGLCYYWAHIAARPLGS